MELEKMELRRLDKIVLGCIFGSVPAALFILFIYSSIAGPSTRQLIIERELSENINGIVDTVYDDEPNHNIRTAILRNHQTYQIEPQWTSEIEKGDSLFKKKGSFFLEIYKKDGKKVVLDYKSTLPPK